MKIFSIKIAAAIALLSTMIACTAKIDSVPTPPPLPEKQRGADYSTKTLSGKIFDQAWEVKTAILKPFGDSATQLSLEFYDEVMTDACSRSPISKNHYATIVIPAVNTPPVEYENDMMNPQSGTNPLVFSTFKDGPRNVIAEQSKVRINSLTDKGMNVSVYAMGRDTDGVVSEINGTVDVLDCRTTVDFSVWSPYAKTYMLTEFDGQSVRKRETFFNYNESKYFDPSSSKNLKVLVFSLFYNVNDESTAAYNFGPIEGLGNTTVSSINGVKTLKYSYHGPLTVQGSNIAINLDIDLQDRGSTVKVNYTVEIPNHISKSSHHFVLIK